MTIPTFIEHIEQLVQRAPTIERTEWIRQSITVLEYAADTIEHLTHERDRAQQHALALTNINERLLSTAQHHIEHRDGCNEDWEHKDYATQGIDCPGCELLAATRYVQDHEELPDWMSQDIQTITLTNQRWL